MAVFAVKAILYFQIYQQYPDSLLRGVMSRLRTNKMVSLKKHYNKNRLKEGNYLPLSSAPYQLSVTFSHIFLCRYSFPNNFYSLNKNNDTTKIDGHKLKGGQKMGRVKNLLSGNGNYLQLRACEQVSRFASTLFKDHPFKMLKTRHIEKLYFCS